MKILKFDEFINEGVNDNFLYHYLDSDKLIAVLAQGYFILNPAKYHTVEYDRSEEKPNLSRLDPEWSDHKPTENWESKRNLKKARLSLTRDQNFHKKTTFGVGTKYRFIFNKECLQHNYKIEPYNYNPRPYGKMGYLIDTESEERIITKDQHIQIDDIKNCILRLECLQPNDKGLTDVIKYAKKRNIELKIIENNEED